MTLLNESGTELRTEEYYRGCKLILHAHGLESFTGLYVAAVSAEGMWEGYEVSENCLLCVIRGILGRN